MPGFDRTGPMGRGPRTGRGLGPCGTGLRRGAGRGFARDYSYGRGFGRGLARDDYQDMDNERIENLEVENQELRKKIKEITQNC